MVSVFDRADEADAEPTRVIEGSTTGIVACDGVILDEKNGELFVVESASDSIRVFNLTDDGDIAPQQVIDGNVPGVLVFDRTTDGNFAPKRSLIGANTLFSDPVGIVLVR